MARHGGRQPDACFRERMVYVTYAAVRLSSAKWGGRVGKGMGGNVGRKAKQVCRHAGRYGRVGLWWEEGGECGGRWGWAMCAAVSSARQGVAGVTALSLQTVSTYGSRTYHQ